MSTWAVQGGNLRLSDPDADGARAVWIAPFLQAGAQAVRGTLQNTAMPCHVWVFGSGDGRNCYECGFTGGANVIIRSVTNGTPGAAVTNAVGDLPSGAVPCQAAHGVPLGTPAALEVRVVGNSIEVRVNGTTILRHTAVNAALLPLRSFGFAGTVNNTVVIAPEVADLVPQTEPTREMLCVVCGGELWTAESEEGGLSRVATNVVSPDGPAHGIDFEQIGLIVNGERAKQFDPVTRAVTNFAPVAGTLPGQTTAGTTTATMLMRFNARVFANDGKNDRQNLAASRIYDRTYWLITDDPGDGFSLTAARAAKVGQPIIGMVEAASDVAVLGCTQSFWSMQGDPLGEIDVGPITIGTGLLSKDGMTLIDDAKVGALSTDGLVVIGGLGFGKVSKPVLTELVEPDAATLTAAIIVRDPGSAITWMFFTARGATDANPSVHVAYHERVGGWQAGAGGFFPVTLPARLGPTAACLWNGQVVLGGTDGRLYVFDPAATSDDGDPIDFRVPLTLMADADPEHDAVLHEVSVVLADTSGPCTATLYGGRTAEEALIGDERREFWERECAARRTLIPQQGRARALVLELSSLSATSRVAIEQVAVEVTLEPILGGPPDTARIPERIGPLTQTAPADTFAPGPGSSGPATDEGESSSRIYPRPPDDALGVAPTEALAMMTLDESTGGTVAEF